MSSKHAPIFIKRFNLNKAIEFLRSEIEPYMDAKGVTIYIRLGAETRRLIQNNLAQVWKGEIAVFMGEENLERQWGEMKLQYLLPLKKVMPEKQPEYEYEYGLMQEVAKALRKREEYMSMTDYQRLCCAASAVIRSKDQPLMLFARWLDKMQRVYGEHGLHLEAKGSNEKALLKDSEREKIQEQAA